MNKLTTIATLSLIGLVGSPALAQTQRDRAEQIAALLADATHDRDTQYVSTGQTRQQTRATPAQLMRQVMAQVQLDDVPGRMALEIWATQTEVPLVVNWASLEAQGIDPDTPVSLNLRRVPADQVLRLIVQQIHPNPFDNDALIIDVEQWYVRVMTRDEALRQSTTRMYFVGDLLMTIPNFTGAPGFDLNEALSNTNSGGSNGGSGGGSGGGESRLFPDDDNEDVDRGPTQQERIEDLLDLIRNSIEPDIWAANGGQYASVRYYRGMLVVNAPDFVHEQLGLEAAVNTQTTPRYRSSNRASDNNQSQRPRPYQRRSSSGNVAGVAPQGPRLGR